MTCHVSADVALACGKEATYGGTAAALGGQDHALAKGTTSINLSLFSLDSYTLFRLVPTATL